MQSALRDDHKVDPVLNGVMLSWAEYLKTKDPVPIKIMKHEQNQKLRIVYRFYYLKDIEKLGNLPIPIISSQILFVFSMYRLFS